MWSRGWMGQTTRWMESSVVGRMFEFFFFKRNFLPQARSLCVREAVSFLCSKAVRDDWDLRAASDVDQVKEAALPTISHCISGELRRHASPTVKPGKLFSPEEQRRRGRCRWEKGEERHRSKSHREVLPHQWSAESEKLSQSPLWVFWRKKLTRGKNHIPITVLNQYIKPSNILSQGCSRKLGPLVILIPPDCVCKQCRSGASRPWECGANTLPFLPRVSAGFA